MAEGEYFLRAVAVLARGGEETFQSKKGAKEVEKVLLLLLSSLFEIWRGLNDMIWPNFYRLTSPLQDLFPCVRSVESLP